MVRSPRKSCKHGVKLNGYCKKKPGPKSSNKSEDFILYEEAKKLYNRWKNDIYLPIECLINMILLYMRKRLIVQFDLTYYTDSKVKIAISNLVKDCNNDIFKWEDSSGNIIVYLKIMQNKIEKKLLIIGDGDIRAAFRTSEFATLLDSRFYLCKCPKKFSKLFTYPNLVQVSINVIQNEKKSGGVLIQMCRPSQVPKNLERLYRRFVSISKIIKEIDQKLQTSLIFYTKPNLWKDSPEYIIEKLKELPH